jgi:two-component system LytT family response regulator
MIKAVIVDDKPASIELLKWLISQHCPEIAEVHSATSVPEALPLLESVQPDLVFLDIQMPKQSGFDLLSQIGRWNFEVVFTTAYNEYAIQAIRFSALDYLLKPVDANELVKAVDRFKVKRIYAPAGEELYRNFLQNISTKEKKLALPGVTEITYVPLDDIIRLQAESNYTRFFFLDKSEFLSAKTLKEYEELLPQERFIRVHRSHIVNKTFINQYNREGMLLVLKDGTSLEVSRRKKAQLMRFMGND